MTVRLTPLERAERRNPFIKRPMLAIYALGALMGLLMAIGALTVGAWFLRMVLG